MQFHPFRRSTKQSLDQLTETLRDRGVSQVSNQSVSWTPVIRPDGKTTGYTAIPLDKELRVPEDIRQELPRMTVSDSQLRNEIFRTVMRWMG